MPPELLVPAFLFGAAAAFTFVGYALRWVFEQCMEPGPDCSYEDYEIYHGCGPKPEPWTDL